MRAVALALLLLTISVPAAAQQLGLGKTCLPDSERPPRLILCPPTRADREWHYYDANSGRKWILPSLWPNETSAAKMRRALYDLDSGAAIPAPR